MSEKIKILGARCLVREFKLDEKTASGIIVPGRDKEPTNKAEVIAVGEGARFDDGTLCPMNVNPGDVVVYAHFAGSPINVDGETFIILNERDILCIVSE